MWTRTASRAAASVMTKTGRFKSTSSLQKKALQALGTASKNKNSVATELDPGLAKPREPPTVVKVENEGPAATQFYDDDDDDVSYASYVPDAPPNGEEHRPILDDILKDKNALLKDVPIMKKAHPASSSLGHLYEFAPKIVVAGVGGAGCNALNNMIAKDLQGVEFLALNTDAQHLSTTLTDQRLQLGVELTRGLGCGANPDAGRLAAEECRHDIEECLKDKHMIFITAGMGGGTGTGAAPVVAEIGYQLGILTVAVVTLPFTFEGTYRRRLALEGIERLQDSVDTLIVIPNQNLFTLATPETSFVDAFRMADDVLLGGVKSITDLMTSPGLINLDFADVQSVMHGMGSALLGTGVSSSEDNRSVEAAQLALDNPLLASDMDISTAKGMLVNITGGPDMTLFEVDKAAQFITQRINDPNANIIFGSAYDESLKGSIRVSVVATGIDQKPFVI